MTETPPQTQILFAQARPKLAELSRRVPELAELPKSPVVAILAYGMGPVRPQLRGIEGLGRHVVADYERMRGISIAVKELAINGYIAKDGKIVPSGKATAKGPDVEKAIEERTLVDEKELQSLTPDEFAKKFPTPQEYQRFMGRPKTQAEVDLIKKTTEAGLMTNTIDKAVAKPGPVERKQITQEVDEDIEAGTSAQNGIMLLRKAKKWDDPLAILTSNFGHISRGLEVLRAFGAKNVVGLSDTQVLRHFGYDQRYLDKYEALNVNPKDLKEQERWRRAVREDAGYLLCDVHHFDDDRQLVQAMHGLRDWYGDEKLHAFGLDKFENLSPEQIRTISQSIDRPAIVKKWLDTPIEVDETAWRNEIKAYNELTEQWLNSVNTS